MLLGRRTLRRNTVGLTLTLCLGLGVITSCGDDDDKDAAISDVTGTWTTKCLTASDSKYLVDSYEFKSGNFTQTQSTYSDAACETQTKSIVAEGTYMIGGTSGEGNKLDIKFTKKSFQADDDATLEEYNAAARCGEGFFTKSVLKELREGDCNGYFAQTEVFSIYKITDSDMQLGKSETDFEGTTEAKRYKVLASTKYTKAEE